VGSAGNVTATSWRFHRIHVAATTARLTGQISELGVHGPDR